MGMNSGQRVQEALSHREPDRIPYALSASMHPARKMGISIREYYSSPERVVEGQVWLREHLGNDMLCCYPCAAMEMAAWGGEVVYFDQGPPNAGTPIIRRPEAILSLEPPSVEESPVLRGVLEATERLRHVVGAAIPLAGVIISPFSLPIMQMGFERYLELIHERPELLEQLLLVNSEYCVAWANAQLKAGAGAIICYDPMSSGTIVPRDLALQYGMPTARNIISRIHGPVMLHYASGRGLELVADIAATGAIGMSVGAGEDLAALKAACRSRLAVVGGLNALEMHRWTVEQAEAEVKKVIAQAGGGGGFVLSDNHGEIPYVVDEEILLAIAAAIRHWGRYPLDWVTDDAA